MAVLQTLRKTTNSSHRKLEEKLSFLLEPDLTFSHYLNLLIKLFGFYAPLEEQFEKIEKSPRFNFPGFDPLPRRKTPLLHKDLTALGLAVKELNSLPRCPALPPVNTPSQMLGCMYVLEGATLGGQIIQRQLKLSLDIDSDTGAAFFNSYGPAVGPMWQSFSRLLEAYSPEDQRTGAGGIEQSISIIEAARATFKQLDEWITFKIKD